MRRVRAAGERGHANHGWLDTWHSFSFADYRDAEHDSFGVLRVLNEDRVAPGAGFATHGHRDMEIVTWVLSGALEHRDSLGNGSVIRPGDVQRMSAGRGIMHSEKNPSPTEPVHLLQIWILPDRAGLDPGYEQRQVDAAAITNVLRLVASRDGRDGSVVVHQDVALHVARLNPGVSVGGAIGADRAVYLHVARGEVDCGSHVLGAGDALKVESESTLDVTAVTPSELLWFDLPAPPTAR